ncbi:MAG: hypothetical protein ACRC1H_11545, partial [Caldilineaceae bacterium]
VGYVAHKVEADQDRPLGPLNYLVRHGQAFLVGHVAAADVWSVPLQLLLVAGAVAALLLVLAALARRRRGYDAAHPPEPVAALLTFLAAPTVAAFLLNLRLPFFPAGGERLLLMVLPYWLLLLAAGATYLWSRSRAGAVAALGLVVAAAVAGVGIYFTTPRYTQDDFRPLLRQVAQQGSDGDSLVAIFPWTVGYWRAYAPATLHGASPLLLGDVAVKFGPDVVAALDNALKRGTLWFPEPLGFGSSLPLEMESWLADHARNVENRWFGPNTRLSAWSGRSAALADPAPNPADFGALRLEASAAAETVVAGGAPLPISLHWSEAIAPVDDLMVTLRLLDGEGRTWAARDFPVGAETAGKTIAHEVAM